MMRLDTVRHDAPSRTARLPLYGQQGAALIVSLVILLVMTVLGIGALSTSTLEEKIVFNSQDWNEAFQLAESGIRDGRTNATVMSQALNLGINGTISYTPPLPPSDPPRYAGNTTLRFASQGSAFGSSMGKLIAYNFDVRGQGWIGVDAANRTTYAANQEGVQRIAPGAQ